MKKIRNFVFMSLAIALAGLSVTPAHAEENRHVRVINRTTSSIRYLYASNVDVDVWAKDILGPFRVLEPNYYIDVDMDDGTGHCLFDIKAVLWDGRQAITHGLNVCTEGSWTVYERDSE